MIARHRGEYSLTLMCRVLAVARSAFYAWQHRTPSARAQEDARPQVLLAAAHRQSHQTYGAPRHQRELRTHAVWVSRRRVARLLRTAGLRAVVPRRWQTTTHADPTLPVAANVLDRAFAVGEPNRAWGADLTYCRTDVKDHPFLRSWRSPGSTHRACGVSDPRHLRRRGVRRRAAA